MALDAIGGVVGAVGMFNYSGEPHVSGSESANRTQGGVGDAAEFAAAVGLNGAAGHAGVIAVGK